MQSSTTRDLRSTAQTSTETYVVVKWRKELLEDLGDNILANNSFLVDRLEWRHSPEGEQIAELADALCRFDGGRAVRCQATQIYLT